MIRINLLGGSRVKMRKAPVLDAAQRITLVCSLILVATALGLGWWYWALSEASARVDADVAAAQQEAARLQSLLAEVREFELRRAQLQQRVQLIERLRTGQSVPMQLLDHISRSVPDMLWLTSLEQSGTEVTIEGRSTTLIALSDFVGNLGGSALLAKPINIVDSQVESVPSSGPAPGPAVELIRFTVKAQVAGAPPAQAAAPGPR